MSCKLFRIRHFLAATTAALGINAFALASVTYVVQKGETLSEISGKKIAGPVWGNNGSLGRVLPLNRRIKDPNLIFPGETIQLPEGLVSETPPFLTRMIASKNAQADEIVQPSSKITEASPTVSCAGGTTEAVKNKPRPSEGPSEAVVELSPYYGFTRISSSDKSTGSPATLTSSLNTGVDLKYIQPWSESFRSFIHLNLGELSFEQPTNSAKSLQNGSNFMSGVGIGGELKLSRALSFAFFGDYQKEAFSRAASTTSVAVDAVSVPEVGGSLSLDLLKSGVFTIGVSGEYSELFQASTAGYRVLQGSLYGGKIYLKQNVGGSALQTELGYFSIQQSTSITNQSENNILLQLRWLLPFGKKEGETR
jgi:LysM repeat protein